MNLLRSFSKYAFLGFAISTGFILGSCFQNRTSANKAPYKELKNFAKVLEHIENNFVDKVEVNELISGAIQGMLRTLDPHSAYMTPEIYREFKQDTSGSFGGLGIQVTIQDKVLTVIAPIEDSPAYRAGIKTRDRIIQIEGKSTRNLSLPEAATLMKGKPGTFVTLGILREGEAKPIKVKVMREIIRVQTVKFALLPSHIGYLRITSFSEGTSRELENAIKTLKKDKDLAGFILDLRENPGGLLDQAVKVSNFFIDEGPIVYTIGRDKEKKETKVALKGRKLTDLPLVTLVDSSSASASEIVAGALQDYGRSVIAGEVSFGKGSVQEIVPVGDDSGLKLTIARYFTPSGRSIQAKGITPDIFLEDLDSETLSKARKQSNNVREKDLARHFKGADETKEVIEKLPIPEQEKPQKELAEKVMANFMVAQAYGIIKTVGLVKDGSKLPEFKLDE
ncbi:S41 family peptidase [bacterium]|nr:S41 family peptidase [bacterium]